MHCSSISEFYNETSYSSCSVVTKFYQHILALVFAVQEISKNPKLLPNITIGFHIYDSYYDARITYRTTLGLLFQSRRFVPNYKCGRQGNLMGVIGGLDSDTSSHMSDILGLYKIPQVGFMGWIYGIFSNLMHLFFPLSDSNFKIEIFDWGKIG